MRGIKLDGLTAQPIPAAPAPTSQPRTRLVGESTRFEALLQTVALHLVCRGEYDENAGVYALTFGRDLTLDEQIWLRSVMLAHGLDWQRVEWRIAPRFEAQTSTPVAVTVSSTDLPQVPVLGPIVCSGWDYAVPRDDYTVVASTGGLDRPRESGLFVDDDLHLADRTNVSTDLVRGVSRTEIQMQLRTTARLRIGDTYQLSISGEDVSARLLTFSVDFNDGSDNGVRAIFEQLEG